MGKAQTPNLGASMVRAEIRAKIGRLQDKLDKRVEGVQDALSEIDHFIATMAERAQARPGGLGRKKK